MRKVPGHAWRGLYPDHITHRRPVPELTLSSNILCLTSALRVGGGLDMALNIAAVWEPFRACLGGRLCLRRSPFRPVCSRATLTSCRMRKPVTVSWCSQETPPGPSALIVGGRRQAPCEGEPCEYLSTGSRSSKVRTSSQTYTNRMGHV